LASLEWSHNVANNCKILSFSDNSSLMQKHTIENLFLIAHGKFSKIVASWTEKFYTYNQGGF